MIIDIVCFIIFLFISYQLAKDDFIFLRKGITIEHIFNAVFLGLPVALIAARIFYIAFHPSLRYLNPLVFLAITYFPGLSLVGGIIGGWSYLVWYTRKQKMPTGRVVDSISIAFLLAVSIGIFLQGIIFLFSQRLTGFEEIGRSIIGLAMVTFVLLEFLKGSLKEGSISFFTIGLYCFLSLISVGFTLLEHRPFSLISTGVSTLLLLFCFGGFIYKERLLPKLLGR